MSGGAKGVISNIPSIDALPYFSYIAYDNLILTAEQATMLNNGYAEYNRYADQYGLPRIVFQEGRNAFVMEDPDNPLNMRQMKEGEKVLISALSGIFDKYWGSMLPMPDSLSLNESEIANITEATDAYNDIIKEVATDNNLAFVDANKVLTQLKTGILIDGVGYNTEFVTGGFFSLDGIHASGRGYAIIANEFIKAINVKYGAMVPLVNVNDYPGIEFP